MTQIVLSGLLMGGLYALLSLGFAVKLRIADIVDLAHGSLVVLAMYSVVVTVNQFGLGLGVAIPIAVLVVVGVAFVVYKSLLGPARWSGGHREQIIYTLLGLSVFQVIFQISFGNSLQSVNLPTTTVTILGTVLDRSQVIAGVIALVVSIGLFLWFRYSYFGRTAEAAGAYQEAAQAVGVPVERVYLMIYLLGSALAGLAGGLISTFQPTSPFFGLEFVLIAVLVTIAARQSFLGCLLVGIGYGLVQALVSRFVGPEAANIVTYLGFLVLIAGLEALRRLRISLELRKGALA